MIKNVFTVSQLNKYIKDVLNAAFPQPVWICGEIQEYDRSRNKTHTFFRLIEKDPETKTIIAKTDLVLFGGRKAYIQHMLKKSENAFELKDDIEVKFSCKIDFYPPHGAMRLVVESIDPTYTLGKLAQQRQKLIAELKKKGVFDRNKKLKLPLVPLRIGLITSDNSAAYNDFVDELKRSHYGFKVYLRNALMQGVKAEADVCNALDELQRINRLDLIVITRGGGSISDLSDFDSKKIAEKIAASKLPVLSGIGHEINNTITDMAAHTYAKTPTAIAQFLISKVDYFNEQLDQHMQRVTELSERLVRDERTKLKDLSVGLQTSTQNYLRKYNERLIEYVHTIRNKPLSNLQNTGRRMVDLQSRLHKSSQVRLDQQRSKLQGFFKIIEIAHNSSVRTQRRQLDEYRKKLFSITQTRVESEKLKLKNFDKIIEIVHPSNTLRRGFSITRSQGGQVIKNINQVKASDKLVTQLISGEVISEVESVKEGDT